MFASCSRFKVKASMNLGRWLALGWLVNFLCTVSVQAEETTSSSWGTQFDPMLVTLVVIGLGAWLGSVSIRGMSFGTSAVLFVALVAGHFGLRMTDNLGTFGLLVFVYCVGLSAGPTFFRGLSRHGRTLALLGAILVFAGGAATWLMAVLMRLPAGLASGLLAGAMTSTPALGAIKQILPHDPDVAVGFGVAYPFGVIAVVLYVQVLPRLLARDDLESAGLSMEGESRIVRRVIEILNPAIVGRRPSSIGAIAETSCQVPRVLREGRFQPIPANFTFELGQQVLVVGTACRVDHVAETLGRILPREDVPLDAEQQRRTIVVTSREIIGRSLKELRLLSRFGITIVRIRRTDLEFVPTASTVIETGDVLTAVGEPGDLERFLRTAGHRPKTMDETDLFSVCAGLLVGVLLGNVRFLLGGETLSLGLAGGPLFIGLLLGHFRHIGRLTGSLPVAARVLMTEAGLALFLADAGIRAGTSFIPVVRDQGLSLCLASMFVAFFPMLVGTVAAVFWFRLPLLQILGAICGGMTSTPGLAAVTNQTESNLPVVSYVAAYPVALALVTLLAPLLTRLLVMLGPTAS